MLLSLIVFVVYWDGGVSLLVELLLQLLLAEVIQLANVLLHLNSFSYLFILLFELLVQNEFLLLLHELSDLVFLNYDNFAAWLL